MDQKNVAQVIGANIYLEPVLGSSSSPRVTCWNEDSSIANQAVDSVEGRPQLFSTSPDRLQVTQIQFNPSLKYGFYAKGIPPLIKSNFFLLSQSL